MGLDAFVEDLLPFLKDNTYIFCVVLFLAGIFAFRYLHNQLENTKSVYKELETNIVNLINSINIQSDKLNDKLGSICNNIESGTSAINYSITNASNNLASIDKGIQQIIISSNNVVNQLDGIKDKICYSGDVFNAINQSKNYKTNYRRDSLEDSITNERSSTIEIDIKKENDDGHKRTEEAN